MFEKTLTDLIRGLRSSAKTGTEPEFISKCLREIQSEIKSKDLSLKAEAIAKLSYLHMIGFDMSWAAFHVIELMACNELEKKRIGYLAATFVFNMNDPVLMLSTNLIKKDLSSNIYAESCVALHSLAQIVSHDLARDLTKDVMGMLKHSSPGIRKRSILVLFRMFVKYPESLQQAFPLVKDKLDDPDPSVVLAAINVIVELGIRHPKSYLFLAPTFFNLLKSDHSVWIRIKIAKLFTSFMIIEPRLIKKLIYTISNIIQNTNAVSLLVECVKMVIHGGLMVSKDTTKQTTDDLLEIVLKKLKMLLLAEDFNLNVIGLEILTDLLEVRPDVAFNFTETVTKSLESGDLDVRSHALGLIPKMVIHENFLDLLQKLMSHILLSSEDLGPVSKEESDNYRSKVASCMIEIITKDTYEYVNDFEWIIEILFDLSKVPGLWLGSKLSDLIIDINLRVPDVREFTVSQIINLINGHVKELCDMEILKSAGFIIGEYPHHVPVSLNFFLVLTAENVSLLPSEVQQVYIQSSFKLFSFWLGQIDVKFDFQPTSKLYTDQLQFICASEYLEVRQRAIQFSNILGEFSRKASKMNSKQEALLFLHSNLRLLFEEELNPTFPNAQNLVPKPAEVNLDEWINREFEFSGEWKIEDYFSDDVDLDCISEKSDEPIKPSNYRNDAFYISVAKNDTKLDEIQIENLSIESSFEPENSPIITTLKKTPKKYSIKKDVDLPMGVTLEHALFSSIHSKMESMAGKNDMDRMDLKFVPLNTSIKKERRKRKPKANPESQK